tara:strand:- start:35272 stop:36231 length:960 start_codon:yes stop_codon:yes gene_type:complete
MKALILGVGGQDGAYLAKFLLNKGYEVIGSSRDCQLSQFSKLKELNIFNEVKKISISINDYSSVFNAIKLYEPDEIYNLAGQSSVGLSFEQPLESIESTIKGTLTILETIKTIDKPIKFYNAGSSDCYGNTNSFPANENTNFNPCSPYGITKASAYWLIKLYRSSFGQNVCTGILFNHESPLRPKRFVTQKIIQTALKIKNGEENKLYLGNIQTKRDWGWAPEYVEAMWLMLQQDQQEDFVIATGKSYSLKSFVEKVFEYFSLDWNEHVVIDRKLIRPNDISDSFANPSYAKDKLGWEAKVHFEQLINNLCEYAVEKNL